MTKKKLSREEIDAFLGSFGVEDLSMRSIWRQSRWFQAAFIFFNLYVIAYILTASFLPDMIFQEGVTKRIYENYAHLLTERALIGLILIFLFNVCFFLTNSFRFVALVCFSYLLNASIDVFAIFTPFFDLGKFNIATLFYWLRPASLVAILVCIWTFDPDF